VYLLNTNPSIQSATFIIIVLSPLLLLGANLLLDDLLAIQETSVERRKYSLLLYFAVVAISAFTLIRSRSSEGFRDVMALTTFNIFTTGLLILCGFTALKVALKRRLESQRRKLIEKINMELPQYLEMFHILISSGTSVLTALKILGENSRKSEVGLIIKSILNQVEAGSSIENSIDSIVVPIGSQQLRRFSDALILGMNRGSSMGQSIQNLIAETRNHSKILILERAGKAEIKLLIPVVFLILPLSVLFAIWPSYLNLVSIMGG
jgi:pilus assembly protein TadC